ncbi:pentapeptide repeat-containing protein [Desulfococcaceae bacterium HSG8]|nr:pentapeptide repeat-containing protein [Desulfococcaceae bacterium HSG8]
MADEEHFVIIRRGAEAWDKWLVENERLVENHDLRPDLSANLSGIGANLRGADLRDLRLIGANLRAILLRANITGARLYCTSRDKWKIDGIKCDYVYWDEEGEIREPKDRDFKPGEFEELYK